MNQVFFHDSRDMSHVADDSVQLIITSPPYFNIKDYAKDGYQQNTHSRKHHAQIGDISCYDNYLDELLKVWQECQRVLKPNGKLAINTPLMPMLKKDMSTHYNRHIFDLNADIQYKIIHNTQLFLLDTYIWNRTNSSKKIMFGSYPYPRNFYAQNTIEFITVYVKDGKPDAVSAQIKEESKLTQQEWLEFTKQIWNIPIPSKKDLGFGIHSALMPEEIPYRLIKLYSFVGDTVLDPFTGSGTTLKIAKSLNREYIGYELMECYSDVIKHKLASVGSSLFNVADK